MFRKNQKFVRLSNGSWFIEDTTPVRERIKECNELLSRSLVYLSHYQFAAFFELSLEALINLPSDIEELKFDFFRRALNTFTIVLNDLINKIIHENGIKSNNIILSKGEIDDESLILIFAKYLMTEDNSLCMLDTIYKILPPDQNTYPTVRQFLKRWEQDFEQDKISNKEINSEQLIKNIVLLVSKAIKNAIIHNKIQKQEDFKRDAILVSDLSTALVMQYVLKNDFFEEVLKQKLKNIVHQLFGSANNSYYQQLIVYLEQPVKLKKENHNIPTLALFHRSNCQIHNNLIKKGFFNENLSLKKESYRRACEESRENYREFIKNTYTS